MMNSLDIEPDFLVIGFQEVVQLNAGQIIATDPEKKYVLLEQSNLPDDL
jgi:hypothetical protein